MLNGRSSLDDTSGEISFNSVVGILGTSISVFLSIFITFVGCSLMVMKVTGCELKAIINSSLSFSSWNNYGIFIVALKILSSSGIYTFFFFVIIGGFCLSSSYLFIK